MLLANIDPVQPGMVGMLAGGGALDQIGRKHNRLWGDPDSAEVIAKIGTLARAAGAVSSLRGTTFGRIGGRPMGMNTAVANTDQWQRIFGVDVEEIDQWEIVRRAELADAAEKAKGARVAGAVRHRPLRRRKLLTPEKLELQIGSYLAMRELIDEWNLDFTGIKGQPELTQYFATMDIAEAFLNDPYDWNGPKEPMVCATEADMDGALTMQLHEAPVGHAGALRRRPPLPRRPRHLGPLQLRPARDVVRRPQRRPGGEPGASVTCTRRCSSSRPAALRCTTSRRPGR